MAPMHVRLYKALKARDRRFDGVFFVGVTSTGIYCRPICPVRTPKAANCRFFDTAQEAEQAHFRPCLRCRPELAPGHAPIDAAERIAQRVVRGLEDGSIAREAGLATIARQFELSPRQFRRIVRRELGVTPMQLLLTRRLLLAKQLLTETVLPITEIAFASGFESLRRFNDAFVSRYALAPSRLRRQVRANARRTGADCSSLQLVYRPPYDWTGVLAFLAPRAIAGVEWVTQDSYARTVQLGDCRGWIRVRPASTPHALALEFSHSLTQVLPALLARTRSLFDLNARPDLIDRHLRRDPRLAPLIRRTPGRRVPGAFHGFELGLRAILGQQISVRSATTLASRVARTFGEPIDTPYAALTHLTPSPARLAGASVPQLAALGIVAARCRSLIALAQAQRSGAMPLEAGLQHDPDEAVARLTALPGIGPWTAQYVLMRALQWPDAFPKEDVAVRAALEAVSARQAEEQSQRWRPWRSYAVLHLWAATSAPPAPPPPSASPPRSDERCGRARVAATRIDTP